MKFRISGPNTGQEWSKEGHRNFPLLTRNFPHTALASISNTAKDVAVSENQKLPIPSETTREFTGDDLEISEIAIVREDPVSLCHLLYYIEVFII